MAAEGRVAQLPQQTDMPGLISRRDVPVAGSMSNQPNYIKQ